MPTFTLKAKICIAIDMGVNLKGRITFIQLGLLSKYTVVMNLGFWASLLHKNVSLQEVPAFCDFWFQSVIMKCEDHEFL